MTDTPRQQQCNGICGQVLPHTAEHFPPNARCAFGLTKTCRTCRQSKLNQWYGENKEKRAAQKKTFRDANKKRLADDRRREPRARAYDFRAAMKKRARKSGCPFSESYLTVDRVEQILRDHTHCECCGVLFQIGTGHFDKNSLSFDRMIPSLGYVEGNIAIICWTCNCYKRDADPATLRRVADYIERTQAAKPAARRAEIDARLAPDPTTAEEDAEFAEWLAKWKPATD